jgi:hypothetical protein
MIMRATAAVLLAGAAGAYASSQFQQTANITLTAKRAGQSTGFKASLNATDPGAAQPQGLKTLTITFPSGTKFNLKSPAVKQCKETDTEITALGCPSNTRVGTGMATANAVPLIAAIPETATVYAGAKDLIFDFVPQGSVGQVLVLHGTISKNVLTTAVPVINLGGVNIVITALTLNIRAIGSGSSAFATAGKCSGGRFVVKSHFLYQTGATLDLSSSSTCNR